MNVNYHIYYFESPKPEDIIYSRGHGYIYESFFNQLNLDFTYHFVESEKAFLNKIELLFSDVISLSNTKEILLPIMHFDIHGDDNGISFTNDNHVLSWLRLGNIIAEINLKVSGVLGIVMASCKGYSSINMLKKENKKPYLFLIGPKSAIKWKDVLIAVMTFYHQYINHDQTIDLSVNIMNIASGLDEPDEFDYSISNLLDTIVDNDELNKIIRYKLSINQ